MTFTTNDYHLDPGAVTRLWMQCKAGEPQRLDVTQLLSDDSFQQLGQLLARFPDLTVTLKDLTDRAWTLQFLRFFPQIRALHLKCVWSLDSLDPIANLKELSQLELGSVLSKSISLAPLVVLPKVKSLLVTGKWGEIFHLGKLQTLERVVLSGFSEGKFEFIAGLPKLKELEVIDSTLKDLSSLSSPSVSSLRLANLRNLTDLEWITGFPQLNQLKLKSLPKVDRLPPQSFLDQLDSFSATHLKTAGIRNTVELQKPKEELFSF
ncbi:MAG: hypothetical protein V4507_14525 [Verrucomicrobiota bacterium]